MASRSDHITDALVEQAAHMVHRWMCEDSWDDDCRPHEGRCVRAAGTALAAAAPDIVQAAKVEALREAAEEFWARLPDGTGNGRAYNSHRVADMLRARAARIEGGQP